MSGCRRSGASHAVVAPPGVPPGGGVEAVAAVDDHRALDEVTQLLTPGALGTAEATRILPQAAPAADAEERNEAERAQLLVSLGAPESGRLPPNIQAAVRRLEEDQKRRSRRIQVDTLDRFLIDLSTFYRDVLTLQLESGSTLVNRHLQRELADYAIQRHWPEAASSENPPLELLRSERLADLPPLLRGQAARGGAARRRRGLAE